MAHKVCWPVPACGARWYAAGGHIVNNCNRESVEINGNRLLECPIAQLLDACGWYGLELSWLGIDWFQLNAAPIVRVGSQ